MTGHWRCSYLWPFCAWKQECLHCLVVSVCVCVLFVGSVIGMHAHMPQAHTHMLPLCVQSWALILLCGNLFYSLTATPCLQIRREENLFFFFKQYSCHFPCQFVIPYFFCTFPLPSHCLLSPQPSTVLLIRCARERKQRVWHFHFCLIIL